MLFVCLLHELFRDFSAGLPEEDYVVNVTFPSQWFVSAFISYLLFDFPHENIGKGYGHLSAHGGSVSLQVGPFVELERVFLQVFLVSA